MSTKKKNSTKTKLGRPHPMPRKAGFIKLLNRNNPKWIWRALSGQLFIGTGAIFLSNEQ